jgi:membrane dipeptidase
MKKYPVFDLHCDLLSYLAHVPGASPDKQDDIGCALPWLQQGNVKLQVMAIYSDVKPGSTDNALEQSLIFRGLLKNYKEYFTQATDVDSVKKSLTGGRTGIIAAIENAAGLCEEGAPLDSCFENLQRIEKNTGRIFYISMTHHGENRFGGGNYSEAGLKEDGKVLLDYLHDKQIAIDLSHTSDALAYGILDYTEKKGLNVPIIASHSNFRPIFDHVRNITDEMTKEIIRRKGLIGMNFLRAYVNNDRPQALLEHIRYGFEHGAGDCLAFGADYFYVKDHPDKSRIPFYFAGHVNAGKYPQILQELSAEHSEERLRALSYENVLNYVERNWK